MKRVHCRVFRFTRRCLSSEIKKAGLGERKSFGSFHSESIETLILQPNETFVIPAIVDEIAEKVTKRFDYLQNGPISIDDRVRWRNLFAIDQSWTFLNHGAFGGALEPIIYEANLFRRYSETQPLRFFDRELFPLLAYTLRAMAVSLRGDVQHLLPIPNVTTGLNAIFNTFAHILDRNDTIVCLSLTYGSTKKMMQDLSHRTGCTLLVIDLTLPIQSQDEILQKIQPHISSCVKLIVLDEITSNTAIKLPVDKISAMCKKQSANKCTVVLDAAHSLFSQYIDLSSYQNVDYWLTNGHKWLGNIKGAGLLYTFPPSSTTPSYLPPLRPPILSHGFAPNSTNKVFSEANKALGGFLWAGCSEYTAYFTLVSTMRIWNSLAKAQTFPNDNSDKKVNEYDKFDGYRRCMKDLMDKVEQVVQDEWGIGEGGFACPRTMRAELPMRLIPLPSYLQKTSADHQYISTDKEAFLLQEELHYGHKIECPVKCLGGRLYVRLSAHMYNSLEDYLKLVRVIKQMK